MGPETGTGAIHCNIILHAIRLIGEMTGFPIWKSNVYFVVYSVIPDRHSIGLYADDGLGFVGLVPGHPDDRIGRPNTNSDKLLEIIYEALLMAPYFQYVFRPAGGIPNPNDPTGVSRIGDAAVSGVTTIEYRQRRKIREHRAEPIKKAARCKNKMQLSRVLIPVLFTKIKPALEKIGDK